MDVKERFLNYVAFDTTSDETSETCPSTEKQKKLGAFLVEEMTKLGLSDVRMDDDGYVYAFLPATPGREKDKCLGLIAHMDTSPAVSGTDIHPQCITYAGGDILLKSGDIISASQFPTLERYIGQELITTDGTTLLGADDKAGVAEIVSACAYLLEHPEISHRPVAIGFTPDEEIGRGADRFDLPHYPAVEGYTVDGGELGEIEYENFNAAAAKITIHGINIHPGTAKNVMKNAILVAQEFMGMLPPAETPAHTEKYEGFYHVCDIAGDESEVRMNYIIRDHDMALFQKRKETMQSIADYLNAKYGESTVDCQLRDSYYNMKEKILPHMDLIENAKKAMEQENVKPEVVPIRGGTDGAVLSYKGLPCPNLCTGGMNFHGILELIPVPSMEAMVRILVHLTEG